jgi:pimeloyl-ACP methyl ester carboxylesterase
MLVRYHPVETVFVGPAPRLAVSVAGAGNLVLLLHGIRGNRGNWAAQVEAFSARFKVAAWDARGFGESDDYEGWLQFDHLIGDVLRVAQHFRGEKFHLVGLAMGGRIGRHVALRYPERLLSLTLVSTNPGFDALSADEVRRFVTERRTRTPATIASLLGSQAAPGALAEVERSVAALREHSYLKMLEASVAQDRAAPIEQIRVPTLVVSGEEDHVLSLNLVRETARRIPGAQLVTMPGVGHFPNLEQPGRFNEIVLPFLEKHDR